MKSQRSYIFNTMLLLLVSTVWVADTVTASLSKTPILGFSFCYAPFAYASYASYTKYGISLEMGGQKYIVATFPGDTVKPGRDHELKNCINALKSSRFDITDLTKKALIMQPVPIGDKVFMIVGLVSTGGKLKLLAHDEMPNAKLGGMMWYLPGLGGRGVPNGWAVGLQGTETTSDTALIAANLSSLGKYQQISHTGSYVDMTTLINQIPPKVVQFKKQKKSGSSDKSKKTPPAAVAAGSANQIFHLPGYQADQLEIYVGDSNSTVDNAIKGYGLDNYAPLVKALKKKSVSSVTLKPGVDASGNSTIVATGKGLTSPIVMPIAHVGTSNHVKLSMPYKVFIRIGSTGSFSTFLLAKDSSVSIELSSRSIKPQAPSAAPATEEYASTAHTSFGVGMAQIPHDTTAFSLAVSYMTPAKKAVYQNVILNKANLKSLFAALTEAPLAFIIVPNFAQRKLHVGVYTLSGKEILDLPSLPIPAYVTQGSMYTKTEAAYMGSDKKVHWLKNIAINGAQKFFLMYEDMYNNAKQ